ncbi:hypothetical protein HOY80DRAFT_610017 [Tuber brumale]|nr:hypothetical protein HOY80DRAFT_610017 [Tuber brumale]
MHHRFDKLWGHHTSMVAEKLAEPGFPISPRLIARPITVTSIEKPEVHDLLFVPQEMNGNNSLALLKSLILNAVVSKSHQAIIENTLTFPPTEAQPTLATTYHPCLGNTICHPTTKRAQ